MSKWWRRYINSSRQIASGDRIEKLRAHIIKCAAEQGFYTPRGFELDEGVLGRTALHQALRGLHAERRIERAKEVASMDCWVATANE